jgi:hypothetical protein
MKTIPRPTTVLYVLCLCAFSYLIAPANAFAQPPSPQNIVPGKKASDSPEAAPPRIDTATLFPFVPINSWVGQRFIFLPGPKASENGTYDDFSGRLVRKQYQGRVAKVISVSDFSGRAHLEFEVEDTKELLRARTLPYKESIKGIALLDDISNARSRWAGKTLWCVLPRLSTYNEQNDMAGSLTVKRYSPVQVVDVVAGWDEEKPVRFLLQTADGKRGFIDLNLSGTNVYKEFRNLFLMEYHFLIEDPRKTYKWPARTWNLIENSQIILGMTTEQVKMSWGAPDKVTPTATGENWVYQAGTLKFNKKGTLTARQ